MEKRVLGRSGIKVSPMGLGCWAIGGQFYMDGRIDGWVGFSWAEHIFKDGRPNEEAYKRLEAVRDILTSGGRTPAQGALAWIWAKSNVTIPIPGFKMVKQVMENAKAMEFGPLTKEQMKEIEECIKD